MQFGPQIPNLSSNLTSEAIWRPKSNFLFVVRNFQEAEAKYKSEVLILFLTTNQFPQNSSKILNNVSKNPQNSNDPFPSMSAAGQFGPNLVILGALATLHCW